MRTAIVCIFIFSVVLSSAQAGESWDTVLGTGDLPGQAGSSIKEPVEGEWQDVLGRTWEALDSYHVSLISTLQEAGLSADERMAVLDNLIESRYQYVEQVAQGNQQLEAVEDIFIENWGRTEELLKKHSGAKDPNAVQAVSEAIRSARKATSELQKDRGNGLAIVKSAKDNLEREAEGRVRQGGEEPQNLRSFFGMDLFVHEVEDRRSEAEKRSGEKSSARPEEDQADNITWLVTRDNFDTYLARAKDVLKNNIDIVFGSGKLAEEYRELYDTFIYSAAWQESCLRQFTRKDGKVVYLRSYNGTSVGFMQINERVWKDIYDRDRLRHDIEYNIRAGCEIAYLYLHRYALGKMKKKGLVGKLSDKTLSRTLYAMYNGGPGQFSKFLGRLRTGAFYDSDKLYFQKYQWVMANDWEKLKRCLF